jgi:peptidyl-prolyl cis-trans isomerase C
MSAENSRSWLPVALVGVMLLLANSALWFGFQASSSSAGPAPDDLRDVASRLASAGVKGEACRYYSQYLEREDVPGQTRAPVAVVTARLLKDEGRYEEALGYLYRVERWAPGSAAAQDAATLIVELLERLGKGRAADAALASRSSLDGAKGAPPPDSTEVVAMLGDKPLTQQQFDGFIETMPPRLQQQLSSPEQREEALKQFVAQQLLFDKASKRGLDKLPEVRRQVDAYAQQLAIGQLLQEELKDKVRPGEEDLRNFYQTNIQRFSDKDGKPVPFEQITDAVGEAYLMSRAQGLSAQFLQEAQASKEVKLFPEKLKAAPTASSTGGGEASK